MGQAEVSLFLLSIEGSPVVFVHIPKTGGTSIRTDRQVSSYRLFSPDDDWRELPSFAFVRDPFDRVESAWRDFRFLRPQTDLDFPEWVEEMNRASEDTIEDPRTMAHHAAPMTHPVHGLRHAKFVGRFERLVEDFAKFCSGLGIVKSPPVPRLRSSSAITRHTWGSSARRLVSTLYADDYAYLEALS